MKKTYLLLLAFFVFFEADVNANNFPAPPEMQKTEKFSFGNYNRQPLPPQFMHEGILGLEKKTRTDWNSQDSLFYAFELALINDFTKSFAYFSRLNTDTLNHPLSLTLYHLTLRKNRRFSRLKTAIKNSPIDNDDVKRIRLRMVDVRKMVEQYVFRIQDDILFPELLDSLHYSYLTAPNYLDEVLIPLVENYKKALSYDVYFTDSRDRVLSKAFEEFGEFLEKHLYITNAYKSYMIARHFDRNNSRVAKKIRETRRELDNQNYLHPSFRQFFGKIREDRYTYSTYKEIEKPIDIDNFISLDDVLSFEKNPDRLPGVDEELVTIVVILLTLIGVILFVRSKKER